MLSCCLMEKGVTTAPHPLLSVPLETMGLAVRTEKCHSLGLDRSSPSLLRPAYFLTSLNGVSLASLKGPGLNVCLDTAQHSWVEGKPNWGVMKVFFTKYLNKIYMHTTHTHTNQHTHTALSMPLVKPLMPHNQMSSVSYRLKTKAGKSESKQRNMRKKKKQKRKGEREGRDFSFLEHTHLC